MATLNQGSIRHAEASRRPPEPMDDSHLRAIIRAEIRGASGYVGGETSEARREAMERYLGELYGDETDGRSKAVDTSIQDAIEDIHPDLIEMFASGDQVVIFQPVGEEDVQSAEQATEYVNYVWNNDNNGYRNIHTCLKDGLLQRTGIFKVWWDVSEKTKRETFTDVSTPQLVQLDEDEGTEIIEYNEAEPDDNVVSLLPDGKLHDVTIRRTEERGRCKVLCVPPEEFLISRRSTSIEDADFTCHKVQKTVSELLQEGFTWDELKDIPSNDEQDYNEERVARFDEDDEWPHREDTLDPATRPIWVYESYLRVDADGDGIAEMRQLLVAGPGYKILRNEEVDDHPFVTWSPIEMPHKFYGRSLADLLFDVQRNKTTILRQNLDNMYNINNNRLLISNKVDLEDALTNRPNQVVRVDDDGGNVAGHAVPLPSIALHDHAHALLEYYDQIREQRTGIFRLSQGLDPSSLHETASGANLILGQAQRRKLLIARNFAECMRITFKKILALLIAHQDRARVIRLRNEWVPMDPRHWNADMDATVSVGLGHGTKEAQVAGMHALLGVQKEIILGQQGMNGPLIKAPHVYNTIKKLLHGMGIRAHSDHIGDPEDPENQPPQQDPPPDPKLVEVQAKAQLAQQEAAAKHEREVKEIELKHQREVYEIELKHQREQMEMRAELDLERDKADAEVSLKRDVAGADVDLKRAVASSDDEIKRSSAKTDEELKKKKSGE